MLLDYKYIKKQGKLSVSYINDKGMKSIIDFNVDKFKSFYDDPNGQLEQPDGKRCSIKYTNDPSIFDIRTFLRELPDNYRKLFAGKTSPKLYTFDIETQLREDREFEEPGDAGMPIHTISVVSPEMNTVVMGDKELNDEDIEWIQSQIRDYLDKLPFFHTLNLKIPSFKYQYYDNEKDMLEYFLKGIVSKVPILSGWNNIRYDWQYITNRIKNNYPNLSITCASASHQCTPKKFVDMKGNDFYCPMPLHTPIIDMSQVMDFDLAVMPIKEANSLDYIASETPGLGVHKIEYDGDLEILYERDYRRYVFYNAIDSILVQLINYRYKTLETMYMQALYCEVKIQDTFSKIAVSEALVWNDFYDHGYKIVYKKDFDVQRGQLRGAYVAQPKPGKWSFVTCNDFASLYPSTIITCNLSFENYIGRYYDDKSLELYKKDPKNYVVVGPVVLRNKGTLAKPELGEEVGVFLNDKALESYRKDPNYFVSVNGHVYKNDKDYSFKRIQAKLKATRNISKYLGKQLDACVMLDVEHILKGRKPSIEPYHDNLVEAIYEMGYDIRSSKDLLNMKEDELKEFKRILGNEITFYTCKEQAMKLLGNSMYGGSSHAAFYWFNINLARDITGEARNLIHMMEKHIPEYFENNWSNMTDLHEKLGIKVNKDYTGKNLVQVIYGDTDSVQADTQIRTNKGLVSIEEFFNRNNTGIINITPNGSELISTDEQILNYDGKKLCYQPVNYIMRHKVSKPKWKLRTKSGKEIIVTEDHSLIVFRNGKKTEVKPKDILKTDKILVIL